MLKILPRVEIRRAAGLEFEGDDPVAPFLLLDQGRQQGIEGVLITISGVIGGAPRALGSQMAVLADGTYCGYISGGCVEAAVAAEALRVLQSGDHATLRFGLGSPFLDVRLPCGGGIDLNMHIRPDGAVISDAVERFSRRAPFALMLPLGKGQAAIEAEPSLAQGSGPDGEYFQRLYLPQTQLIAVGRGPEFLALSRIARASGFHVSPFSPDADNIDSLARERLAPVSLISLADAPAMPVDAWTAVVFAFHDHDWETALLTQALDTPAFYIGALGSRRTHAVRRERLAARGLAESAIQRIRGPIGLFGPTRNATSLSLSVLAEIAKERQQRFPI